jgi:hypothetical protein
MSKPRSPNYPSTSLAEAIDYITKIYKADMRNKMSGDTVSRHMGYKSVNGRSLLKIGALKGYGLLEGSTQELRVSEKAVEIIAEPKGGDKWLRLVREAAFTPKVFSELNDHYEGRRPSPENLRSELIRRRFTLEGVERAAKVYLDNYDLVTPDGNGYTAKIEVEADAPIEQEAYQSRQHVMTQNVPQEKAAPPVHSGGAQSPSRPVSINY